LQVVIPVVGENMTKMLLRQQHHVQKQEEEKQAKQAASMSSIFRNEDQSADLSPIEPSFEHLMLG